MEELNEINELEIYRKKLVDIKKQLIYIGNLSSDEKEAMKLKLMYAEKEVRKNISRILREEREMLGGKKK